MLNLDRDYEYFGKLRGVIEIDETKIRKKEYIKGRMVEGHEIFWLIAREAGGFRLEICPNNQRDSETLISRHFSDGWAAYARLYEHGYVHQTVILEENFVDPVTVPTLKKLSPTGVP